MLNDYARLDRRVSEERLNCKIYALTCDLVFGPSLRAMGVGQTIVLCRLPYARQIGGPQRAMVCPTNDQYCA